MMREEILKAIENSNIGTAAKRVLIEYVSKESYLGAQAFAYGYYAAGDMSIKFVLDLIRVAVKQCKYSFTDKMGELIGQDNL
jgi:hypothetical protein